MQDKLIFNTSVENLQTSLLAIRQMPEKVRHAFYLTEVGKEVIKGLQLEDETRKKAGKDGMTWTENEIEEALVKLRAASSDDFKKILQLLPGPVQAIATEHFKKERQNIGLNKSTQVVPLIKGAKVGSAGYEIWLAKRRTHNKNTQPESKVAVSSKTPLAPKAPTAPKIPVAKPKAGKYSTFLNKKPNNKLKQGKAGKSKFEDKK